MTARYRCPWCGEGMKTASACLNHEFKRHRKLIIDRLGLIEAFGTRKEAIAP